MCPGMVLILCVATAGNVAALPLPPPFSPPPPVADSIQMTMLMNGSFVDGVITAVFTRVLYTPVLGYVSVDANAPQNVIWAVNTDSSATPTGPADRCVGSWRRGRGVFVL